MKRSSNSILNTHQRNPQLLQNKSLDCLLLTVLIDEQSQILSVVGADIEQQSRTLARPETQGDVLSSQGHVTVDGGRQSTAVPDELIWLLEGVADRCT